MYAHSCVSRFLLWHLNGYLLIFDNQSYRGPASALAVASGGFFVLSINRSLFLGIDAYLGFFCYAIDT